MRNLQHLLRRCSHAVLYLALAAVLGCSVNKAQETDTSRDARALQDFNARVQNYIKVHRQAEQKFGLTVHLKSVRSANEIIKRQHAMAEHIGALRSKANEGDLFTHEIGAYFARQLDAAYQSNPEGISASLACVSEIVEQKLKPNDVYPETWDYNMMPPTMLLHIPRLPQELEYRIVNKDLIIRDVEANMIVDVMRNAITTLPEGAKCDD
jgi:hypothetical protein